MFSFGWPELFLLAVVILLVVGPQDIPKVMYGIGRIAQRLGYIKYIFTQRFDDFMQEAELDKIRESKSEPAAPDAPKDEEKAS